MSKINDTYLPKEALITKKIVITNTKENRFIKFMLLKIIEKIDKFILKYTLIKGVRSTIRNLDNNDSEIHELPKAEFRLFMELNRRYSEIAIN